MGDSFRSVLAGYCFTHSLTSLIVSGLHRGGMTPADVTTMPR